MHKYPSNPQFEISDEYSSADSDSQSSDDPELFRSEYLVEDISQFIEEHRDFFIASMNGNLNKWVEKNLPLNERRYLARFSASLVANIKRSDDVRDDGYRFSKKAMACFIDAIAGLEDATEGRNHYTIKTRKELLQKFLAVNEHVTNVLFFNLPNITHIIEKWEQASQAPLYIAENLANSMRKIFENPKASQVKPFQDVTNVMPHSDLNEIKKGFC